MSDDLRERVARAIYDRSWMYDRTKPWTLASENEERLCYWMADAALAEMGGVQNQLDEALNQLDSARHSVEVLERRLAAIEPAPVSVREAARVLLAYMDQPDFVQVADKVGQVKRRGFEGEFTVALRAIAEGKE